MYVSILRPITPSPKAHFDVSGAKLSNPRHWIDLRAADGPTRKAYYALDCDERFLRKHLTGRTDVLDLFAAAEPSLPMAPYLHVVFDAQQDRALPYPKLMDNHTGTEKPEVLAHQLGTLALLGQYHGTATMGSVGKRSEVEMASLRRFIDKARVEKFPGLEDFRSLSPTQNAYPD